MGHGGYLTVINDRSKPVRTYVTNFNCVFDNGQEGSNPSLFNDTEIPEKSRLPKSGKGQYIEGNKTGTCFFHEGRFTLKIEDASTGVLIGNVAFAATPELWHVSSDNTDLIDVYLNNNDDQSLIKVTLEDS